jgi:hypothetical protein
MIRKLFKQIFTLVKSLKESSKRFPETIFIALGVVIIGITLNHVDYNETENIENLRRILLTLILGIPMYSMAKLIVEKFKLVFLHRIVIDIFLAIFLVIYHHFSPKDVNSEFMIKFMLLNISFYLFFTLIPYIFNRENYSRYVLKLITNMLITLLYSFVLYLGINAIVFTVEKLFELDFSNEIYFDIFIIIFGLFSVTHFLSNLLPIDEDIDNEYYPTIWKILFIYIITPLLSIYTIILYAYFIRLVIIKEFPINMLGNLVVWYGLLSVIILFFINRIKKSNEYIKGFYKYFPVIIILPLVMLFVAIGGRISDFGITPSRYFVVISGLWVFGNMLYLFFSKNFKSKILVISAIFVLLISSYGPQSAFSLSIKNQNNRFENVLTELNMLKDRHIISRNDLTDNEERSINEFIQYFERYHSFDKVKVLPENFEYEDMETIFGFKYYYYYNRGNDRGTKNISYYYEFRSMLINIKDYDYLLDVEFTISEDFIYESDDVVTKYNKNDNSLKIIIDGNEVANVDVIEFMKNYNEMRNGIEPNSIDDVTVNMNLDEIDLMFIISNMYYEVLNQNNEINDGNLDFKILIKIK